MTDKLVRISLTLLTVLLSILVLGGPARADADDGAYVISATRNGRIVDLTIQSPALQGTGKARLLLPTGWDANRIGPGRSSTCCTEPAPTRPPGPRRPVP